MGARGSLFSGIGCDCLRSVRSTASTVSGCPTTPLSSPRLAIASWFSAPLQAWSGSGLTPSASWVSGPGEEPLAAAQRELLEETGYVSESWTPLGTFTNDGNRGAGTAHLFRARDARQSAMPGSDDLEETETMLLSMSDLQQALRDGDVPVISVAATIALAAMDDMQVLARIPPAGPRPLA